MAKPKVKVMKVKGDRKAARMIASMSNDGWTVQSQSTRKAWFSFLSGIFTRKQVHTITFIKEAQQAPAQKAP